MKRRKKLTQEELIKLLKFMQDNLVENDNGMGSIKIMLSVESHQDDEAGLAGKDLSTTTKTEQTNDLITNKNKKNEN